MTTEAHDLHVYGEPQHLSKGLSDEAQSALERRQKRELTHIESKAGRFTISVQLDFEDNLEIVLYASNLTIPISQIVVVDAAGADHRLADEYAE